MQSRAMANIFVGLFLDRTKINLNLRGWICGCSPSKLWKSDTKMIRGSPIFSVSCGRWMVVEDNLRDSDELSGCSPVANATALQPNGYSRRLTPVQRSRRPRSGFCNLLIPSGTTDHTQTSVTISQQSGGVKSRSKQRGILIDECLAIQSRV